ncbi:MAG TPA: type II toxin-antitoxin system PemK/MazF family toxin [Casimicrobiaceae bacterium]|nr:type II toxin-antitoxin system PemK/MazF family toxin [Casimicrobiaceae bacterium]
MASFERFDVVRVPFPFTDRQAEKNRPALVISDGAAFNRPAGHSAMAMITSASHAPWPLDVPVSNLAAAGLPAPSIVRFKLFTLDHRLVRGKLGRLSDQDRAKTQRALRRLLP